MTGSDSSFGWGCGTDEGCTSMIEGWRALAATIPASWSPAWVMPVILMVDLGPLEMACRWDEKRERCCFRPRAKTLLAMDVEGTWKNMKPLGMRCLCR